MWFVVGSTIASICFLVVCDFIICPFMWFVKGLFEKISTNPHEKYKKSCKHSINHIKINIKQQKTRLVNSNGMYIECGLMLLCNVGFVVW